MKKRMPMNQHIRSGSIHILFWASPARELILISNDYKLKWWTFLVPNSTHSNGLF